MSTRGSDRYELSDLLCTLLQQGAGKRYPGQVALGLMFDPAAAAAAHAAGVGATIETTLGTAVPTFTGKASDPPVRGRYKRALSDGHVTLKGPMMTTSRSSWACAPRWRSTSCR